jgi:hypothetical protein
MSDMTSVIVPKSDQINADDLIGRTMTIAIRDVQIKGGQEQPVSIFFEGSEKAFRPCKSMSRVLVAGWGADAKEYVGRSLTLYRDPTVKWGGLEVGGIRISHMSHLEAPMTMALTATKGSRKPYTVKPIQIAAPRAGAVNAAALIEAIEACNTQAEMRQWWAQHGETIPDADFEPVFGAFNRLLAVVKARPASPQPVPGSEAEAGPPSEGEDGTASLEGSDDSDMGEFDPLRAAADRLIADAGTTGLAADLKLKGKDLDDYTALPAEMQAEVDAAIEARRQVLEQ